MTVGLVGYLVYRRRLGVDPRRIHRRGLASPDRLPRFTRKRRGRRRARRRGSRPR